MALLGFVACSSTEKAVEEDANAVAEQAKTEIENAAEDLKNESEEVQAQAEEKTAEAKTAFGNYTGTEASKLSCSAGEDVRTVSVLNGETGGCGVVYNKAGVDKTIAVANNVMEYCDQVVAKVKGNLEGAGFSCE